MVGKWQRWSLSGATGVATALVMLGAATARAQEAGSPPAWQQQFGTPEEDSASAVAVSKQGVYVVGYASGQLGEDPWAGGNDAFVAKYDFAGKRVWLRQFGTSGQDRAVAVAADDAGNVYVAGQTSGSLGFESNRGGSDFFVARFGVNGELLFVRQFGTDTEDTATGITLPRVAGQDGLFVVGYSLGRMDGSPSTGDNDVVVAKFDTGGNSYWTSQFGTPAKDIALAVAVNDSEDIYIAGHTQGSLDGVTQPLYEDLFLVKLNIRGERLWTRQLSSPAGSTTSSSDDRATGVAVGADGSVYVAGYTRGSLDENIPVGGYDAVLLRFDPEGNRLWTRQLGTTASDSAHAVAVAADGTILLAGSTSGALDGNSSLGGSDVFLTTYDAEGRRRGTRQVGSSGSDRGMGVASSLEGGVSLGGSTYGSLNGFTNSGKLDAILFRF